MYTAKLSDATGSFRVLQTTKLSQTAVMILREGEKSSEQMNIHQKSDQILLVVEGEVEAEVKGEKRRLKQGDVCVVPAPALRTASSMPVRARR